MKHFLKESLQHTRSYFISFLNIHIQDILKGQERYTRLKFTFLQLETNICICVNTFLSSLITEISGISTACSLNTYYTHSEPNCIVAHEMKMATSYQCMSLELV